MPLHAFRLRSDTALMPIDEYRIANRANWDARVELHYPSAEYGVEKFISDPTHLSDVVRFDREKLGDVSGKRLLHLQCHIGTDTVSWARLGATATGTDLSGNSIEAARRLSEDSGTPVRFIVSELYDTPEVLNEKFDVVYTGVGAICWLPDIKKWAETVSTFLDPGGIFYMREGHPMMWSLDFDDTDGLKVIYPYFETVEPVAEHEEETYAGEGKVSSPLTYGWNHGIGETINALLMAGFRIDRVEEYDECEWQALEQMVLDEDGLWRRVEGRELVPLMWSVMATKL
jgi:SAM-dependent methyltransferase